MNRLKPIVGSWYLRREDSQRFEVVSVEDGAVEVQDYDGNLGELDIKTWFTQDLEVIDPPEDLTGALDIDEPDEADGGDGAESGDDWAAKTRVANEEIWNDTASDEDDWDKGLRNEPTGNQPNADRRGRDA